MICPTPPSPRPRRAARSLRLAVLAGALAPLALGVALALAQQADLPPPTGGEQIAFRHLTTEQGLPNASVTAVAQDRLGFIWIGTPDGLVRYDGEEMRPFRHGSDSTTVSGNVVTALSAAGPASLYVGTSVGLDRYDAAREAFVRIHGLPSPDVVAIATDAEGGAWAGTRAGLAYVAPDADRARAYRYDPSRPASLPSDEVWSVYVAPDGGVWVGTSGGLARLDPSTGRARTFEPAEGPLPPISAIAPREAGGLYIGTQGTGLFVFQPGTGTFSPVNLGDDVNARVVTSVHEDGGGTLWVGLLGGGLRRLSPGATAPTVYTGRLDDPGSLADDNVSDLLEDRQGVLWVATYNGLDRFDLARGTAVRLRSDPDTPSALASNDVRAVLAVPDGRLFVGTDRSLDISDDGRTFRHLQFGSSAGLPAHPVSALLRTRDGTLWVGTDGAGLHTLNGDQTRRAPLVSAVGNGNTEIAVHGLFEDSRSRLWIGTRADGLLLYDRATERAVAYRPNAADASSLASDEVFAIAETPDRKIWVGTAAGLCRVDNAGDTGAFTCFAPGSEPTDLAGGRVSALLARSDGELWLGTDAGLARLDTGDLNAGFTPYTEADTDLPGASVYGIVEDESGFLWLSTSGGLTRFERSTEVFTSRLGSDGDAPVYNSAITRGPDGRIYAGGTAGLLSFLPTRLKETNPNAPQTVLTGVDVAGEAVEPGRQSPLDVAAPVATALRLRYDQDYVTFRFAGLHFSDPTQNTYRYRLLGDHEAWREAGTRREAAYTNLSPGKYTFEVIATSADGVASADPARLAVVVRPPWYRTVWAYLAYFLAFVATLVVADRVQRRRLVQRERERAERRETELRAETAEAEQRKAEAEAERQRAEAEARTAEAAALQAENDRKAAEIEGAREVRKANDKLAAANARLEASLHELQATQAQLVQSEKLASLGQLTAGIAHEIKNPLNFVNNFADLTVELAGEIDEELRASPERTVGEALVDIEDLLGDLRDNARRIHEHGQRADRIVRSMLLHSRGGSGERGRVELNRFVEEYANLAYHGARANDQDFNIALEWDLDPEMGEIEIVPQELGRVLINLLTNAFHAVTDRRRDPATPEDYQPTVTLHTRCADTTAVLTIEDNGTGIPEAVRQQIFEPFFTTKPTGEGTGLGLSLVHDIVTGVHGGEVSVESTEGEGTSFIIVLPTRPELED